MLQDVSKYVDPNPSQSINFFRLGGRICLVDLPGYGFAYAKEEKKESWEELVSFCDAFD